MRAELFRFLCFINCFCDILTSESEGILGETAAALLMNPLLLAHKATHQSQIIPEKKAIYRRPVTPGPNALRLSPIHPDETMSVKKRRDRVKALIDNPTLLSTPEPFGRLRPMSARKATSPRNNVCSTSDPVSPMVRDDFYDEIEAVIRSSDLDSCSCLAARPEMKKLSKDKLLDLLHVAHTLSKISKTSGELYRNLFIDIVTKIVPENHSRSFKDFIMAAVQNRTPIHLFSLACKHINLLSNEELSELLLVMESKLVWQRIDSIGVSDMKIFNEMVMIIAFNLENTEIIIELDHVKGVLSMKEDASARYIITKSRSKLNVIYITTLIVAGLKSANYEDTDEEFMSALTQFFEMSHKDFHLDSYTILGFINQIWKVVLPSVKPEQTDALGRFLKVLHEVIKKQTDLSYIPIKMIGVEDLYLYFQDNLVHLASARLKLYQTNKITKFQLIYLLNSAATLNNGDGSELIVALIGSINISPLDLDGNDLKSLFLRPRILLEGSFTLPRQYSGEICTANVDMKQSEDIIWNLPADLFLNEEPSDSSDRYLILKVISDLPRLFLFKVFGIPINNFSKILLGMNELPETQELLDIVNFFLERWCATNFETRRYPIFKIISSEEDKIVSF